MENPDLVTLLRPLMAYNMSGSHKTRRFVDTIVGFDYFSI